MLFRSLKIKFTTEPVLAQPNTHAPFILEVDASNEAVGAVLSQRQEDGKTHPIGYFSKTLNNAEKNYAISEKELLALILALENWRHHLAGYHVNGGPGVYIYTDHLPLVNFATLPTNPRRAR